MRKLAVVLIVGLAAVVMLALNMPVVAGPGPKVECTEFLGTNRGTSGEWSRCGAHDDTNVTVLTLGVPEGCPEGTQGYIQHVECARDNGCDPAHPVRCTVWEECWGGCRIVGSSTPTTQCGNLTIDPGEECEVQSDCPRGEDCAANCQCVATPTPTPTPTHDENGEPNFCYGNGACTPWSWTPCIDGKQTRWCEGCVPLPPDELQISAECGDCGVAGWYESRPCGAVETVPVGYVTIRGSYKTSLLIAKIYNGNGWIDPCYMSPESEDPPGPWSAQYVLSPGTARFGLFERGEDRGQDQRPVWTVEVKVLAGEHLEIVAHDEEL